MPDTVDKAQKLEEKLQKALKEKSQITYKSESNSNTAIKILSELISGIAVGVILGYFLDKYFNTLPFLLILCTLLGFAGAMLNIYRDLTK